MTASSWPAFRALPAYLGGKRRLAPLIFALLQEAIPREIWCGLTFLDPFLGAGSVSLFAKAQGLRVICNDLALRSAAVGHALVANSSVTLSQADLAALLQEPKGLYPSVAQERYSPSVFPRSHAALLDRVLHNLQRCAEPTRSLLLVLVVKWVLRVQPMSMLRSTDARAASSGDFDKVSGRRLGHYLGAMRLLKVEAWRGLMEEVNSGVFPGRGEAWQLDAFEFLAQVDGDVVYMDPPYPGTAAYEREYEVLDDLLEGQKRSTSGFSRSTDRLDDLLEACKHIPTLLLSLNNAVLDQEELEKLVRRHRSNVTCLAVPYRHLSSVASEKKNEENQEYIVLATN